MTTQYIRYPDPLNGEPIQVYATFAAFPPLESDGALAIALDTSSLYVFDTGTSSWSLIASPGTSYNVNKFTLTPTDITNGYVTLTSAPASLSGTILNVIGGPMQDYSADFTVAGNQLSWSGLGLDGVLVSGDKLVVQFD